MTQQARWLRFNLVGVAGFAVQMATLAALERWSTAPAGIAVTMAVLAAVSHNFLWHERVTWPGQPREGRWRRWLAFNVSTGVVSVLVNLIVTTTVAAATGAPLLVSNVIAVASASLVNFWVSDRAVFNSSPRAWAAVTLFIPMSTSRRQPDTTCTRNVPRLPMSDGRIYGVIDPKVR